MTDPRAAFRVFENANLRDLLTAEAPPDTVIEAEKGAAIAVVDVDSHHWREPPTVAELVCHIGATSPVPDAAWTTHGRGLKLVFIGRHHRDRALAAAFSVPVSFNVELLRHTRHPRSRSTQHGASECGPVLFFDTDPEADFRFQMTRTIAGAALAEALAKVGLQEGGRYDHDRCPIDPGATSDAKGCVVVVERGVYCHRCAGRGKKLAEYLPPGFLPWSRVFRPAMSELERLAEHFVHWVHARHVLRHRYRNLSEPLLREGYDRMLKSRHGDEDPRIRGVFNPNLDIVRGEGIWLAADSLAPTVADNDVVNGLPTVQYVFDDGEGGLAVAVDPIRRSKTKHRTPDGYTPLRAVKGISFAEDAGTVPIIVRPAPQHPIELPTDPLPEAEALLALQKSFPLLHPVYLKACLGAAICGDARMGQPPMLACTGPSGSAKEQTIRLAASFMGQDVTKLSLADSEEVFARQIGIAVTSGERFLVFDEFGKTQALVKKLKAILQISARITWRPLYQNKLVQTPMRGAFFFPCVRFPDFLTTSQGFVRRTRRVHLFRRVPNWAETSGGDTSQWRDRSRANAHIANSILTHVWRLCHGHDFRFF
jgi:hypothetical protein